MRVTNKMLAQSLMNNVNNNLQMLQKYENQLSSGKRTNKPSDDPIAAAQILNARSALKSQEQYDNNMNYANGWLSTVDDALASAGDVLQRAREIAVYGSTGTTPKDSMEAMGAEVDSLISEMVQIANTNYAGSYVFGGGETGTAPFTVPDGNIQFMSISNTDTQENQKLLLDNTYLQKIEISPGVTIDISAGEKSFHSNNSGDPELNGMFKTLINLKTDLDDGDQSKVNSDLSGIDAQIDNVLNERAMVGAKSNRIELAQSRATTYTTNITTLISKLEDADYAEVSTGYSAQQTVYQSSLAVGARIIQPSLLDFLK